LFLFWSWFCRELFSRELILHIKLYTRFNSRQHHRGCLLEWAVGQPPLLCPGQRQRTYRSNQERNWYNTRYLLSYLPGCGERKFSNLVSSRRYVRPCNKQQQQVVVLLSHIDELSSAVVVVVVVALEPCTTSKPPDRPLDQLSSSLFLDQRQGNRKLAAWAWDGRLHYFYAPEEMAPLNTRSGKAFRSSSYRPSSKIVGHGFKMPCSWCPVDCIWVAIPVLPLICWKSFLECGTDLLWTDILSGVGLDSNIVIISPDIAHWFYLDAPVTNTYLSLSLNALVHVLCATRKRFTWVCSVICACRMMLQRYQVPWESLVPVFT
jgi:hypothetical protein